MGTIWSHLELIIHKQSLIYGNEFKNSNSHSETTLLNVSWCSTTYNGPPDENPEALKTTLIHWNAHKKWYKRYTLIDS